jgi:hypothetical protein
MKILYKRALDALKKVILFSAVFHLVLLLAYSIWTSKFEYLNYFKILDLQLLFPVNIYGYPSQALSIATMVLIYLLMYFKFSNRKPE